MSKAKPGRARGGAPIPHDASKQGTTQAPQSPRSPARPATTQELITRIWDTLEWRKTLQVAIVIAVTGATAALAMAGLGLLAGALTSPAIWPAGAITAAVSYAAARSRHR
jgi:hypothetical protein